MTFYLMCVHIILVWFGLLSVTFLERAAHSVGRLFSLYIDYFTPINVYVALSVFTRIAGTSYAEFVE